MDPRIVDFIRANRQRFTREAIRQQLIEAGHDPAEIDATWAALDAPDPDETAGEGFWGRFALFLIGLNVAVFALVVVASGLLGSLPQGGLWLAVTLAIALGIGALIAWAIVAAVGPTKLARTTAMTIGAVIPLLFALLIGGSCYALVAGIGPPPPPAHSGVMEIRIDPPLQFAGSGAANCQPHGGETGFSVFGDVGTHRERTVSVSIEFFRGGGDGGPTPAQGADGIATLWIMLNPRTEGVTPGESYTNTGDAVLDLEGTPDGLSGTLTFSGLAPEPIERAPDVIVNTEPISGTVTWTCE